jgi:hypothetical protein
LFCRYLPVVAISEVKGVLAIQRHSAHAGHGHGHEVH